VCTTPDGWLPGVVIVKGGQAAHRMVMNVQTIDRQWSMFSNPLMIVKKQLLAD